MYKTLTAFILAAATNCPLVNVAGTYMVQLITENPSNDCPAKGGGTVVIQSDGLMVPGVALGGNPTSFNFGGGSAGRFGGRVEPSQGTMQWVGTSSHTYFAIEYTGTLRQGQLSGKFSAQSSKGKQCNGKVVGFKTGK